MLDKRYQGILSGQIVFSTLNRRRGEIITEIEPERNIKSLIILACDCRARLTIAYRREMAVKLIRITI
jgi:hypothetical protein